MTQLLGRPINDDPWMVVQLVHSTQEENILEGGVVMVQIEVGYWDISSHTLRSILRITPQR